MRMSEAFFALTVWRGTQQPTRAMPHAPLPQGLVVLAWRCMASMSDTCSLVHTAGCLRGWPTIPMEPIVHNYYNMELGWYLHLMLKHVLGERRAARGGGAALGRADWRA